MDPTILIFIGIVLVAFGGLLLTYGWDVFAKRDPFARKQIFYESKRVIHILRFKRLKRNLDTNIKLFIYPILFGVTILSVGGICTTYGWESKFSNDQKKAIIRSVASEIMININIVRDEKFNVNNLDSAGFVIYPRFSCIALESIITSGLFNGEIDKELYTRVFEMVELVNSFNHRLDFIENMLMKASKDDIVSTRIKLRDSAFRTQILSQSKELGYLLIDKYGISYNDSFFLDLKDK